MSGDMIRDGSAENPQMVTIPRNQLACLLDAVRSVRTGFLICAPRFAAGSRGEAMISVAAELGKTIDEIMKKLDAQPKNDSGK